MNIKTMQDSRTIQASLVQPSDTNYHGTIFGGSMMAYIDEVAAIAAMRHSRRPVVTASIDSIDFGSRKNGTFHLFGSHCNLYGTHIDGSICKSHFRKFANG